jgi:hypothetical protein
MLAQRCAQLRESEVGVVRTRQQINVNHENHHEASAVYFVDSEPSR